MVLQDYLINENHISTTTVPIVAKLGKLVTYIKGLIAIKSNNTLITWSCMVV